MNPDYLFNRDFFYFSGMDIKIEKGDRYTTIRVLVEKLNSQIAPLLKSEMILVTGEGESNIILDVSACSFCDSAGLSTILVGNRLCKNSNGVFVIAGVQEGVERLINISQADKFLNIVYRVDKADDKMNSLLDKKE